MNISNDEIIALINKKLPAARAVPLTDWNSNTTKDGIWFRGSEDYAQDGKRIFNYYSKTAKMMHPRIEKLLAKYGYYIEPYDCGTAMAYK